MRTFTILFFCLIIGFHSFAQKNHNRLINGMYVQWGYNTEWYTKSSIHFKMSNGNDFTLHNVKAHDKPDMDAVYKEPLEVSIPQYNYRVGFYLNKMHTRAIEINFDHAKYVVTDGQSARVTGRIDGKPVNGDSIMNRETFLHFEHTDGANWLHINYVKQHSLFTTKKSGRPLLNYIWKLGAGINIPRTDFTWRGERLNNNFHVAGYNFGAEGGIRLYALKKFFFEFTAKTGYVRYVNALACTPTMKGNRATHGFGYFELIGLIGYDINF
ncbi:MAG: hypothetical protein ABIN36_18210 [Ferruginibacter sp.]